MKSVRHALILQLIDTMDIETQEELAEELKRHGTSVTQATVSRDIKELRLVKELTDKGRYKYVPSDRGDRGHGNRFIRIFAESVISMAGAENLVVIKTLSGVANAAAEAIDNMKWPEIVGTLAGDNTIFVALKSSAMVEGVIERFRGLMK
ncbi:MAG: arginine repressor [Clostridiales bacterium]|nr:arginine repressor [Clostridiales bacterium]